MAELAYAADLKSVARRACGFESHLGYCIFLQSSPGAYHVGMESSIGPKVGNLVELDWDTLMSSGHDVSIWSLWKDCVGVVIECYGIRCRVFWCGLAGDDEMVTCPLRTTLRILS